MARVEDRIQDLSAKVTALIMLVQNLYADSLAECNDPAGVGKILVEGVYKGERITEETFPWG